MITEQIKQEIKQAAFDKVPNTSQTGSMWKAGFENGATTALSKPEWMWPMIMKYQEWLFQSDYAYLDGFQKFVSRPQGDGFYYTVTDTDISEEEVKAAFIEHLKQQQNGANS